MLPPLPGTAYVSVFCDDLIRVKAFISADMLLGNCQGKGLRALPARAQFLST